MKKLILLFTLFSISLLSFTETGADPTYDDFLERYVSFQNKAWCGDFKDTDVAAGVTVPSGISSYYYDETGIYFVGGGIVGSGRFFSGNAPLPENNNYAAYITARRLNTQTNELLYFGLRPDNVFDYTLTNTLALYSNSDIYTLPNDWWGFAASNGLEVHLTAIHIFDLDHMFELGLISAPTQVALELGGYQADIVSPFTHDNTIPLEVYIQSWVDFVEIEINVWRLNASNQRAGLLSTDVVSPTYNQIVKSYDFTYTYDFGITDDFNYEVEIDGESYFLTVEDSTTLAEDIPVLIIAVIALLIFFLYIAWIKGIPMVILLTIPLTIFLAYEFREYTALMITFLGLIFFQLILFYDRMSKS